MWLMFSDSFLSVVTPGSDPKSPKLLVRARREGDIQRIFPGAVVEKRPERDYLFRALIDRELVAIAIASEVNAISYSNFKNSVKNNRLHDALARVWSVMASLQPTPPYSGTRARGQKGLL